MGIVKHRGQIACDKRWPDGSRFTRVFKNKTQAKQLLDRINVSIADGSWPDFKETLKLRDRGVVTLRAFSETYIEGYAKVRNKKRAWERKVVSFKVLNNRMGKLELDAITPARLHDYVQWRKGNGIADATINQDLATVKHMFTYAVDIGVIGSDPVAKFKKMRVEQKETRRYSDAEVQRVLASVRPEYRPIFVFILETGCRREEALSLQHWQVHEESRAVVFSENTKSRKFRQVPLTMSAIEAVHVLPPVDGCPFVFYNPKTRDRWADCWKPWKQAREAAALPELRVKDLRRHYAIGLAEDGAVMHDIQQVLGHSSVATTEIHYAHFSPNHSSRRILRLLEGGKETKQKHDENDEKLWNLVDRRKAI